MTEQRLEVEGGAEAVLEKKTQEVSRKCLNRRKRRLQQLTPQQLKTHELSGDLQLCVKDLDLEKALALYRQAKESHVLPNKEAFNNLLALAAGLGEQGSGSFPVRTVDPPSDLEAAMTIFEDAKKADIPIQEASYSGLIRCLANNGRHLEGLALLREMQQKELKLRLRSYSALLAAFCKNGDANVSVQLFDELTDKYSLEPTEKEYVYMLSLCSLLNDQRFYEYLHSMLEDILVPSMSTWDVVKTWFSAPEREPSYNISIDHISPNGQFKEFPHKLYSIELSDSDRSQLIEQIDNCFKSIASATGDSKPCSNSDKKAKQIGDKWELYKSWINGDASIPQCDSAKSYDILIDGANVGFYQQNFVNAPGHVDYMQIDAMIRHCKSIGRRPLVILHCRHLFPDVLPENVSGVVNSWKEQKVLYTTPAKCNDDLFWMYAAMIFNCDVITNDEMRDHHFKMLSPRWFMRWKERHQVRFKFGKFDHGEKRRELELSMPPPYSHRIQTFDPNTPVSTNSNNKHTPAMHYFFPAVESNEWLVVAPNNFNQ